MESKVVISRPLKLENAGNETEIQEHRVLQRKKTGTMNEMKYKRKCV